MNRMLVATDGSAQADAAVALACTLALGCKASVVVATVVEPPIPVTDLPDPHSAQAIYDSLRETAQSRLDRAIEQCERSGVTAEPLLLEGNAALELLRASREKKAELIVCGSHGRGPFGRFMLGSVSTRLVHRSHIPVLVVPHPDNTETSD